MANGALTTFAPAPNTTVNGIAVTNTAVYAGGCFTKVGAIDRLRLAAFHPTTGALLAWAPTADADGQRDPADAGRLADHRGRRIRHI